MADFLPAWEALPRFRPGGSPQAFAFYFVSLSLSFGSFFLVSAFRGFPRRHAFARRHAIESDGQSAAERSLPLPCENSDERTAVGWLLSKGPGVFAPFEPSRGYLGSFRTACSARAPVRRFQTHPRQPTRKHP